MRRLWTILAVVMVACGGGGSPASAPPAATLTIEGRAFGRVPVVAPGDTITIVNNDGVRHTFTSAEGRWEAVQLGGGESKTFVVPADLAPGRYVFFCAVHPDSMGGSLVVEG